MHDLGGEQINLREVRAITGLSLVYAFRMLGMFMVLPVLATYGQDLHGATPMLIGVAIGAYGLTQALLQMPFGMLSDRIGRLPLIVLGLLVFAAGAALAASSDSIWWVIVGRIVQGAGAISAVVMALLSDLTREQHRTNAMAVIGVSIGLSFAIAMVIGPLMTHAFGLSGLFWLTSAMALFGVLIVLFLVPKVPPSTVQRESSMRPEALRTTLQHPELLRLNIGIGTLHAILMASFVALPMALVEWGGLPKEQHWWVYLLAMVVGFIGMVPLIIYGEKQRRMKLVLNVAIGLLLLCVLFFGVLARSLNLLLLGMVLFFLAFNVLEACLPSLVSKTAPAGAKGTAMGVYATSQFLGAAVGGVLGGWLYQQAGLLAVFMGCAVLALGWLGFAVSMCEPAYVTSLRYRIASKLLSEAGLLEKLHAVRGVTEALLVPAETAVYLKVDQQQLDRVALAHLLNTYQEPY